MINLQNTDIGETVKTLRRVRGMTRIKLSEAVGISESHLKKIEEGTRHPGIDTYQKILEMLEVDIVIISKEKTVKGNCIAKMQKILMSSAEPQALFMTNMLECMAQNMESVV